MGERLFSGWGVRTLAEGEGRFNPIGYHVGTIWPFDNSFIAWGLRRYGFKDEAARIAEGILDAARFFDGRLPEAFGGYPRSMTRYPVQYPTACTPQAWSTAAPLLLLRTMLGLEPLDDHLIIDPAIPASLGQLELLDIPGRWGRIDAFGRGRVASSPAKRREDRLAMTGGLRCCRRRQVTAAPTAVIGWSSSAAGSGACRPPASSAGNRSRSHWSTAVTTISSSPCSTRRRPACWHPARSRQPCATSSASEKNVRVQLAEVDRLRPRPQGGPCHRGPGRWPWSIPTTA